MCASRQGSRSDRVMQGVRLRKAIISVSILVFIFGLSYNKPTVVKICLLKRFNIWSLRLACGEIGSSGFSMGLLDDIFSQVVYLLWFALGFLEFITCVVVRLFLFLATNTWNSTRCSSMCCDAFIPKCPNGLKVCIRGLKASEYTNRKENMPYVFKWLKHILEVTIIDYKLLK